MKKLLLVSNFKNTVNIFKDFEKNYKGKTVTFIPTAAKAEKFSFFTIFNKRLIKRTGLIPDELDISKESYETIKNKIQTNDYIFINGGNTFFLLQELKRTGADKLIKSEIEKGKLYIGESAGAVIASPDIEYIKAMDDMTKAPLLKDFTGLCLTDFYTLPHNDVKAFKNAIQKIKEEYSKKINLKIINNNQAILVDGESIKVING